MIVRMWEARVADGRLAEAAAWAGGVLVPSGRMAGAAAVELAVAEPDGAQPGRLVLVTWWASAPRWTEPDPPGGLLSRWHAWSFARLEASGPLPGVPPGIDAAGPAT